MTSSPAVAAIVATPTSRLRIHKRSTGSSPSVSVTSIDEFIPTTKFGKFGGYIALAGGCLLQLTLGSLFCFGNLVPYIASYLTHNDYMLATDKNNFDIATVYNQYTSQTNWVLFAMITIETLFIVFGGNIEIKVGPTKTLMMSSMLVTLGFGLTYFSLVYNSFCLVVITYGIIFGIGVGIGYPILVIVCMKWFPTKKGVVCGFISSIFGCGAFVFDSIQTKLVNPNNLAIDPNYGYVLQYSVIDRIPFMFAYVAFIMLTMQIISIITVRNPPWFISQNEVIGDPDGESNLSQSQIRYEAFSLTLKQTMSFWVFWELWINNFLYCVVLMFITMEWKVFAMNYMNITDDVFLSIVGSISSLINGIGRFLWGIFYDKNQSFRISMGAQTSIITVFVATLPLIKYIGDISTIKVIFAIWLFIIWSCIACQFAFLPSCMMKTFGAKYVGSILGVFVGGEIFATALVAILTGYVFKNTDSNWFLYCITMAICTFISTILSILYRPGRIDRKKYLKDSFLKNKSYDTMNTTTQTK